MRKLNFITNLKSEKIYYYMYMNIRTLEDKIRKKIKINKIKLKVQYIRR